MPNHAYSVMVVSGDSEVIKSFKEKHFDDDDNFSLQSIKPLPVELAGTRAPPLEANPALIEKYGCDNWYNWCIQNWGTKWDTYDGTLTQNEDNELTATFCTAWDIPEPIFTAIATMYPTLDIVIKCVEESGGFSGTITITEGTIETDLTDDEDQWKEYAEEIMGYNFDEDDED